MENSAKFLVIGDSCTDVFVYGKCDRMCPEAPVPVHVRTRETRNAGMAGNVLANLRSLGCECELITNTEKIEKTRIVDQVSGQMIVRLDTPDSVASITIDDIKKYPIESYDAIIISDYNKGFLSTEVIEEIFTLHDLIFIDTKRIIGDWCDKPNVYVKINNLEYEASARINPKISEQNNLIVTLGGDGCVFRDQEYAVKRVQVRDVAGAGDTFLAGLACKYVESKDMDESLAFANQCARWAVSQRGVVSIDEGSVCAF